MFDAALLLEAAKQGSVEAVQAALKRGEDVDARDENGWTPLALAAADGHVKLIQLLVQHHADVNAQNRWGETALSRAAFGGHLAAVRLLLDHGADVELADEDGDTPLLVAVIQAQLEVVRLLLEKNIDLDARNNAGLDTLQVAERGGQKEIIAVLQASQEKWVVRPADVVAGVWETAKSLESWISQSIAMGTPGAPRPDTKAKETIEHVVPSVTDTLPELLELCVGMVETQDMCEDVVQRLLEAQYALDDRKETAPRETQATLLQISSRFRAFLTQHGKKPVVQRLVATHTIIAQLREFHSDLDSLCTRVPARPVGVQVDWQQVCDTKAVEVEERLALVLQTNTINLMSELPSVESQANALLLLSCEHDRHHDSYSTKSRELLSSATKKVARLSGAPIPAVPEWFIPSHEVQRQARPFNRGSYGQVYRGTWRGASVVIKCVDVKSEHEKSTFLREAKIWHKARHPHVVAFFGACHVTSPCFFVCEEAANGNLVEYLEDKKGARLPLVWGKLYEAALGLQFLHEVGIVHGDLKCNQILVSAGGVAKLTDFGLAFIRAESRPVVPVGGAVRWKAPECLLGEGTEPTPESDVYSFGMCIVEAVSDNLPWGMYLPDEMVVDKHRHREFISRPAEFENDKQWELVLAMCAFEPSRRMKLLDVIERLRKFAGSEIANEEEGKTIRMSKFEDAAPSEIRRDAETNDTTIHTQPHMDVGSRQSPGLTTSRTRSGNLVSTTLKPNSHAPHLQTATTVAWVNDNQHLNCCNCNKAFHLLRRRHHCRVCHKVVCRKCSVSRPVRVCVSCVMTRLPEAFTSTAGGSRGLTRGGTSAYCSTEKSAPSSFLDLQSTLADLQSDPTLMLTRIERADVTMDEIIGRGAYSEVYSGHYNGEKVAVKILASDDTRYVRWFIDEVKMNASMEHPHIVRYIGVAWQSLSAMCMVVEYMDGGDLRTLLNEYRVSNHAVGFDHEKATIAYQVIQALTYLHSFSPPVIHRDLKSRNILLDSEHQAKLTDFGISRKVDTTMTAGVGTVRWMPPEVILGYDYTESADIFSFGAVLSELDTHNIPYESASHNIPEMVVIQKVATNEISIEFSQAGPGSMAELGRACVSFHPSDRPTAAYILSKLQAILASELV